MINKPILNQLNLHFLNQCNYSCIYCFADKSTESYPKLSQLIQWVDKISNYFKLNKVSNPRINLVGGEPLIYKNIIPLIKYIYSKGIKVSIVTNGSLLTEKFLKKVGNYISMIGVSVDTLDKDTALKIGRVDSNGKVLKIDHLMSICKLIKSMGIQLKINTVVSKFNYNEDFIPFLNEVDADKVKFLELYLIDNMNDYSLRDKLSRAEYLKFCSKHSSCENVFQESNDEFDGGYIMLNYKGDLIVNSENKHINCGNIEINDFSLLANKALGKVKFTNYDLRNKVS